MRRQDLEHIIRASAEITGEYEFIIVGSQSILGEHLAPEDELTVSAELDIYPRMRPDLADEIDGAIGEGSLFHEQFGYYAQGVGPETAVLPAGWEQRLWRVQNENTNGRLGLCLDVLDLFMSKSWAGREKDRFFCIALISHQYVDAQQALDMVAGMPLDNAQQRTLTARIRRWAAMAKKSGLGS